MRGGGGGGNGGGGGVGVEECGGGIVPTMRDLVEDGCRVSGGRANRSVGVGVDCCGGGIVVYGWDVSGRESMVVGCRCEPKKPKPKIIQILLD